MKYTFSLEVLLDHKKRLEDEARRIWLEAQSKVDAEIARLNEYYDQVDRTRADNQTLEKTGGALAPQLAQNNLFITGQKIRIESQRMKIRDLKMTADELQEAMIEAAKETKTLQKLRERGLEEFKKARRVREMKENDELVVLRHKPSGTGD